MPRVSSRSVVWCGTLFHSICLRHFPFHLSTACSIPSVYGMFHSICLWHVPFHLSMACSIPCLWHVPFHLSTCSIPSVYMFHSICLHVPFSLSITCSIPSVYDMFHSICLWQVCFTTGANSSDHNVSCVELSGTRFCPQYLSRLFASFKAVSRFGLAVRR